MSWDWKPGAYRDYVSAREDLIKEQSEKNFKEMISVCQSIIENYWYEAKDMDEYADLVQIYEKTVVAFWKKYKTLESLYHIVYFYGDWSFTLCIYGMDTGPDRWLEHMKKGLLYAQLYHEKVNTDYSAVLSIRLYRTLYELCPTEGLDYLRKACSMAKEWVCRLKTPFLLDEYLRVSFAALCAVDEVKWKDEEEKQAAKQEMEMFFEDYKTVEEDVYFFPQEPKKETFREEWDLFEKMDHMRREALFDSEKIFAEHRKEIYHCIRICRQLQQTAHYEGLRPLLLEGKKLEKRSKLYCRLLAYGIEMIGKVDYQHMTERMMEQFGREAAEDTYAKYMMYLCTRFLEMIYKGEHIRIIQPFLLSCVPIEERSGLLKYLEYQML